MSQLTPSPTVTDTARDQRTWRDYLGLTLRGLFMGASDIVPGVSGATIALIFGIYEELIESIRTIGEPHFLRAALRLRLQEALRILNWPFLVSLGTGILIAILSLSHALEWLLLYHPALLWSFFFGLVLASVVTVAQRIPRWSPTLLAALALGTVGAYWLVGLVPARTPDTYLFLFFSGAIAICAMILPGISGAFILVLLGKYQYVLSAVTSRDLVTLLFVALGAGIGLITFAQIIGWLFRKYHDMTVALLTGLMLGSLRKVWPWKVDLAYLVDAQGALVLDSHGEKIAAVQQNVLPTLMIEGAFNWEIVFATLLAFAGLGLVILLHRFAKEI